MKHGHCPAKGKRSPTYITWDTMMQRCTNPKNPNYKNYGGRGIKVCTRWYNFSAFVADMGDRPAGMTLERVRNDRGYYSNNCVWATRKQQQNNNRRNRRVRCYSGPKGLKTITEWAAISGRHYTTIIHALDRGWTAKEAVFGKPK